MLPRSAVEARSRMQFSRYTSRRSKKADALISAERTDSAYGICFFVDQNIGL
jgi:hypothetical protein